MINNYYEYFIIIIIENAKIIKTMVLIMLRR